MTLAALLTLVAALHADVARARPMAEAIASTDATPLEATTLVVIGLYEQSLDPSRGVPFGLSCCVRYSAPLAHWARRALGILRTGMAACGTLAGALGRYHHGGSCRVDAYAAREARSVARLRARAIALRAAVGGGPQ